MYEDTIYVFKDSDLQIFGKSIYEINIDEKEIQNINSRSRIDIVSVWLEKNCDKKYAFELLANIPDKGQYDES